MGTIYIDGQFRSTTKPVKIVGGSVSQGGTVSPEVLAQFVTKEELEKRLDESVKENLDYNELNETLEVK